MALALKTIVFLAALTFVYYHVFHGKDTNIARSAWDLLSDGEGDQIWLLVALLLMPINWGVEALKWRYLVRKVELISIGTAFRATMTGSTVSLLMPNRTGGFLGRIIHLDPKYRGEAAFASVLGSLAQLLVTVLLGTAAFYMLRSDLSNGFPWEHRLGSWWSPFFVNLALLVLLLLYTKPLWMKAVAVRLPIIKRFADKADVLGRYSGKEKLIVLLISLVRYVVFAIQFFLVLKWTGINPPVEKTFALIALTWLCVAILPSFVLGNLGVRESMVITVFSLVTVDNELLLIASLSIWMINLVLPALIGGFILLLTRFRWRSAEE